MLRQIALFGFSALAKTSMAPALQSALIGEGNFDQSGRPPGSIAPAPTAFDRRALLSRAPRLIIASRGRPRS